MRLAIVSDTHMPRGARALPPRALELMRGADAILHAGDLTRLSVLHELLTLGPAVYAIHGNVDDAEVRRALPETREEAFAGVVLGMTHIPGPHAGRLERLQRQFPGAAAVIYGHTHMPEHLEHAGFQAFNPGSPTEKRRASAHTIGIATIESGAVRFEHVLVA